MEEAITFPEPEINSSSCRIIFVHRACSGGENEMIVVVKVARSARPISNREGKLQPATMPV
jgi:hypothetical protein